MYKIESKVLSYLMAAAQKEMYQSMVYVQLAAQANKLGFIPAEKYFLKESNEEKEHFQGHYDYITGRGEDFKVPAIPAPEVAGKSLYELVEFAKNMEVEVSKFYNTITKEIEEVDAMTGEHLLKYLRIQFEAINFYVDACATLEGLDKTGELVAQHSIFE